MDIRERKRLGITCLVMLVIAAGGMPWFLMQLYYPEVPNSTLGCALIAVWIASCHAGYDIHKNQAKRREFRQRSDREQIFLYNFQPCAYELLMIPLPYLAGTIAIAIKMWEFEAYQPLYVMIGLMLVTALLAYIAAKRRATEKEEVAEVLYL